MRSFAQLTLFGWVGPRAAKFLESSDLPAHLISNLYHALPPLPKIGHSCETFCKLKWHKAKKLYY